MADKQKQARTGTKPDPVKEKDRGEMIKVIFDNSGNQPEPSFDEKAPQYGDSHMTANIKALNAFFKTNNPVDQKIMSNMYMDSFQNWAEQKDYSLRSSLRQIHQFSSLLQDATCAVDKVDVKFDKLPNTRTPGAGLLTIDVTKRGQHVFAEQYNYF